MANQFVFVNNFLTTVGATFSSTATTLTLSSSAGLPVLAAGQVMPITLNDAATGLISEIMYATAISGANLTVTIGEEGTTAQNWAVGDRAFCDFTAGTVAPISTINNVQLGSYSYAVDSGVANAISIGLNPAPAALTDGMEIRTKVAATNTGAVTINTNGLGAVAANGITGALAAGTLIAGNPYTFVYSSSLAAWVLTGVDALNSANATNATNAPNATNLVGSGTISSTTTGGAGLSVSTAGTVTGTIGSGVTGYTQALGTSNTTIATTAFAVPGYSHGSSGYEKLPSGLIIQWGTAALAGTVTNTITFPIAFPHAALNGSVSQNGVYASVVVSVNGLTATTMGVYNGGGGINIYWTAIGY